MGGRELHTVGRELHTAVTDIWSEDPPDPSASRRLDEPDISAIDAIDARLRAVERLVKIFAVERYIYLAISIASFLVLVAFAAYLFATSGLEGKNSLFALLFVAPSGALVYVSGAFLKMWTQALQVLGGKVGEG
jgi:hypothetical protein